MKHLLSASAILAMTTSLASASGLDRSGQSISVLFEEGNYAELSFGYTNPDVRGNDLASQGAGTSSTGNVADSFVTGGFGLKYQFNDQWSAAFIIDEPFGSDVSYPTGESLLFGGTGAVVDSTAYTGILRYKFNENFSVHGGIKYQTLSADVPVIGFAFAGLNGYEARFKTDGAFGYLIGGAYERPEIALRIAVTYHSEITHNLRTRETVPTAAVPLFGAQVLSNTSVDTPEAINIDFQTGIAENTLLFGSVRYANYDDVVVSPVVFDGVVGQTTEGDSITDLESAFDLSLGVGYRINDTWSVSAAYGYTGEGSDDLVSPLAPTNGSQSITLGARYTHENIVVAGGVRYTRLGDAFAETGTPDVARAEFDNNDAVSLGLRVGFSF